MEEGGVFALDVGCVDFAEVSVDDFVDGCDCGWGGRKQGLYFGGSGITDLFLLKVRDWICETMIQIR